MSEANRRSSEVIHLGDLKPDPQNVREHNPKNLGVIVEAIHAVGPARSIVIDENNVVLCGNATISALGEVGIEQVRVIDRRPNEIVAVRVTGLTDSQKKHLAISDNRANELSEFKPKELLLQLDSIDVDHLDLGFTDADINAIAAEIAPPEIEDPKPPSDRRRITLKYDDASAAIIRKFIGDAEFDLARKDAAEVILNRMQALAASEPGCAA